MSSPAIGSDEVKDCICSICEEHVDADFYCQTCSKFYCRKCIELHDKRFKITHSAYGRNNMKKWPVSKEVKEFLLKCEAHNETQIEMLCEDHSQLCCMSCTLLNHSQCNRVTPISELTSRQSTDLNRLSTKLETILGDLKSMQNIQEASLLSLQGSYNEHEGSVMQHMRLNINTAVDTCEDSCVSAYDDNEQYMFIKKDVSISIYSILDKFDNSTVKELNEMKGEVRNIKSYITSSIHKCNGLQNDLTQLYESIQKIGDNKELCLIASIKCEHKIQQSLTVLGKSDNVFTVQGKSEHNVRIPGDSKPCWIHAICILSDGQVLIVDSNNYKVKLLNQQYEVVSHYIVADCPKDICQITPSEVAVTLGDEVQFITVAQSQLVAGRKLHLQYACRGITHHQGDLYITSGTALFKHSLTGTLVCRLYETDERTELRCAVSTTGDKLYITILIQHALLTLAKDGRVLAIFTDPGLRWPRSIHVTIAGQVLVCGLQSHTILQMDSEGRRKLATLATRRDGVEYPWSACYSRTTSSIIVGREGNNVLVFIIK